MTRRALSSARSPFLFCFFFQAEDGIRDYKVTGVQTCALPISRSRRRRTSCGRKLSSRRSAGSSPRRSRSTATGAPAFGRRSTSSTSWSGRSRRTTTGLAGVPVRATAASLRRVSAIRRSSLQPSPALPDLNRIARMATIRGLAPVLIVPEVLETLEHYRDKLGFETREWEANPAAYGYARRDECHIHFNQGEQPRPNSEVVQPDLFDVYLWVDDVAALHDEFVGRGADLLHAPIERPWGMLEIRVQDPNGYILAFGQRTS